MPRKKPAPSRIPFQNIPGGIAFGELGELLGYRLRRAQMAMHRDFNTTLAGLDLTQKQTAILWLVSNNPAVSQASVASALAMDRPTMMALTARLEERGLITRVRSNADRRRQELQITAKGNSLLTRVKERIAEHEQRMRAMFTDDEFAALLSALQKFQEL